MRRQSGPAEDGHDQNKGEDESEENGRASGSNARDLLKAAKLPRGPLAWINRKFFTPLSTSNGALAN